MKYISSNKINAFFERISKANSLDIVGEIHDKETLRVLMPGDVCLMDTVTTDYNGRICLVKSPAEPKTVYQRIFIDGDIAIVCDPTDGEENDRCALDDLKVHGVVTGIIRNLEAESPVDLAAFNEFCTKFPIDPIIKYYPMREDYIMAIKRRERGGGYGCAFRGYAYGFTQGRRAERNAQRRAHRMKQRKEAAQHE